MKKVCVFLALLGLAVPCVSAIENPLLPVPVESYQLDNGMTVFLVEDHSVPIAVVNINYMVGSKNERVGRTGFAHLFEHMMFQGSKNWNEDYFKPLKEIGARINGGTNTDRTRYWEQVPAAYLERALWLEADRMGFLLDALTQERLDNQISVVKNERRSRYENSPYGLVNEAFVAAMYPPNHPYSWTTIGSMADLEAATQDDVREFFKMYYAPNNASICIAGDFETEEVKALVERYFSAIPPGPPVTRLDRWVPKIEGEIVLNMQDRVQLARSYISWHTVPWYTAEDAELEAFGRILGGGKTSRLYRELVYERQIAQDAIAYHDASQLAGYFRVMVSPRPGHTIAELEAAAQEVLTEALEQGITPKELERTQTAITSEFVRARQRVGGFSGISDRLNHYYHYLGEADSYRWDLQRFLDLTPEQVTAAARRYLGPDRLILRVEPMPQLAASSAGPAAEVDRSVMPGPADSNPLTLPERQRFTLDNGLEVVLVEHHELPVVDAVLVVRGGSSLDPPERTGLASLTAALLQEGAAGRSSLELAEILEGIGADLDTSAQAEAFYVELSVLKSRLAEGMALFSDVIARPDFPEAELERKRTERLVRLQQLEDNARYVAQLALDRVVFGDHPYGQPPYGDQGGVGEITLAEVRNLWNKSFTPANSTLLVVGDLSRTELEAGLSTSLGVWKATGKRMPAPAPTVQRGARTVYLIDKPGAAQSRIAAGIVGVARNDGSYATLEVMNWILGGQFMSRLNLNLREDKGYTYGVRSSFDYGAVSGLFSVSTAVETDVTGDAVKEMMAELEAITGSRPVTEEEMIFARDGISNDYAHRFETTGQIASELLDEVLYGLPADAMETHPTKVGAVTRDQVTEVATRYLDLDNLAIVIMGDLAVIREQVEALDLGPIVMLDRQGRPAS